MVDELIESTLSVHSVYAVESWIKERITPDGSKIFQISNKELENISSLRSPNKVLAIARIPSCSFSPESLKNSLNLVLDGISDPGNLGTLIRSADWFGVDNIILSRDSAEATNPKVVQASMGSILRVKLHYLDLSKFFSAHETAETVVFGASTGGINIYEMSLPGKGLIVLGNESQGISPGLRKFITTWVSIPGYGIKKHSAESLNVAVAGGIILSEFRRA